MRALPLTYQFFDFIVYSQQFADPGPSKVSCVEAILTAGAFVQLTANC